MNIGNNEYLNSRRSSLRLTVQAATAVCYTNTSALAQRNFQKCDLIFKIGNQQTAMSTAPFQHSCSSLAGQAAL